MMQLITLVPCAGANDSLPGKGNDYKTDPLWQRIEALSLDDPGAAYPFSAKLARENRCTPRFARQALAEYKRFIYLCCISPQGASPSPVVDEVWHMHLTYTQHYWEALCEKTIGRKLHHHPSKGGAEEADRHRKWYGDTLDLYLKTFGALPPALFWPCMSPEKGKKKAFRLPSIFAANALKWWLPVMIYMFLPGCSSDAMGVLIPLFIVMAIVIYSNSVSTVSANEPQAGDKKKSSNDGGSSGCGGGGDGGGDGGGCGGGCGGCGGCGG